MSEEKPKKKRGRKKRVPPKETQEQVAAEREKVKAITKSEFGRPTKYQKKFCKMLIEHMAKGLSYESFAGYLGVNRSTIYEWEKHEDFSDAKNLGIEASRYFWENAGINGLWVPEGVKFNSAVWIFNMKNRLKWTDRVVEESENTIQTVRIELPKLGQEEVISLEPKKIDNKGES